MITPSRVCNFMVSVTVRTIFDYTLITIKSQAEARVTIQEIKIFAFKVWITNMGTHFFRNKTFLFVKIERRNFERFQEMNNPKDAEKFSFLSWQPKIFCS